MANSRRSLEPPGPDARRRLLRAGIASAATGSVIYLLVMHLVFPQIAAHLSSAQVEWLGQALARHPAAVLAAVVCIAALLGLPVIGVFRWVHGPLTRR